MYLIATSRIHVPGDPQTIILYLKKKKNLNCESPVFEGEADGVMERNWS